MTATAAPAPSGGLRSLLAVRAFRTLLIANVLAAVSFGTARFVFVWLVGELTDWNPATAILGIVIGLPPLALSAWAGALADRMSPHRLALILFAASSVAFAVTGILIAIDAMTVPLAIICGFVAAIAPSMLIPLMQAIVPTVAPPGQLMQAVALQNLTMMVSVMGGIFVGGAVMQAAGTIAGFWQLTAFTAAGFVLVAGRGLPGRLSGSGDRRASIREGARIAMRTQPLASLLLLSAVFGMAITTSALLLPEFARDVLGSDSLAASLLNVAMSVGMMITSMLLATRWHPGRPGLLLTIFVVVPLGGGLIAIGLSRTYAFTALWSFAWGLSGGVSMTLLRGLLQTHTRPDLMGRVMGLAAMAQNGIFPITALLLFGLVALTSVADAMVIIGIVCCVLTWAISAHPHLRTLTATAPTPDPTPTRSCRAE